MTTEEIDKLDRSYWRNRCIEAREELKKVDITINEYSRVNRILRIDLYNARCNNEAMEHLLSSKTKFTNESHINLI